MYRYIAGCHFKKLEKRVCTARSIEQMEPQDIWKTRLHRAVMLKSLAQIPSGVQALQITSYDGVSRRSNSPKLSISSLTLDIAAPRPPNLPPIDSAIKPHQRPRRRRHQRRARGKKPHPSGRAQHIEDRIRVELVVGVALLDPEPVAESDARGEAEGGEHGDGVGRREEEEVEDERQRGDQVEGEVVAEEEDGGPGREDEGCVDLERDIRIGFSCLGGRVVGWRC